MDDESYALPASQRHLTALILRKLLAFSTRAVTATLERIHKRLLAIRDKTPVPEGIISSIIAAQDLEDDYLEDFEDLEGTTRDRSKEAKINQELLEQEIEELEQSKYWRLSLQTWVKWVRRVKQSFLRNLVVPRNTWRNISKQTVTKTSWFSSVEPIRILFQQAFIKNG